jgi:hypothetical protein
LLADFDRIDPKMSTLEHLALAGVTHFAVNDQGLSFELASRLAPNQASNQGAYEVAPLPSAATPDLEAIETPEYGESGQSDALKQLRALNLMAYPGR